MFFITADTSNIEFLFNDIWTAVGHMDVPEIKSETRFIGIPTNKEVWKLQNDFVGMNYFILITNVRKINILSMLSCLLVTCQ